LDSVPNHPRALHGIGLLAAQAGDVEQAARWLERAVELDVGSADTHNNLGNVRQLQERWEDAAACHRRATELDPSNATAHYNLGVALGQYGELEASAAAYRCCLAIEPVHGEALCNLGVALTGLGRSEAAIECYDQALAVTPDDAAVHMARGSALRDLGRHADAASSYERAMRIDPSREPLLGHLVEALRGNRPTSAPDTYVQTLFDNLAEDFDQSLLVLLGYQSPKRLRWILDQQLPGQRFANVLDLGCGTGLAGVELRRLADVLWGMDLSRKMLARAEAKGVYDHLHWGSIAEFLRRTEGTFDLFVAADVFVYAGDLHGIFAAVRERSRPGAHLVFSTEIAEGREFQVQTTGRYAHSRAYIGRLCVLHRFTAVYAGVHPVRAERGKTAEGWYYLLRVDEAVD
jgi:predicted TPR repeat methyltransferase